MGCAPWFEFKVLENKLRPSSVAVRRHLPPRGKALYTENKLRPLIFKNFLSKIFRKSKMGCAPHSSPFGDTFPPGGRLYQRHLFEISNGL